jgi:HK97 family phage portal protein
MLSKIEDTYNLGHQPLVPYQKSNPNISPVIAGVSTIRSTIDYALAQQYAPDYSFDVTPYNAYKYYKQVFPVRDAVSTIADAVAGLPFGVAGADDTEKIIKDNDYIDLLRHPGTEVSGDDLITELTTSYLLTNELWLILRGRVTAQPVSLSYARPYDISITGTIDQTDGTPNTIQTTSPRDNRTYYKHIIDGQLRYLDSTRVESALNEIYPHIGIVTLGDQFRGLSLLTSVRKELDQIVYGNVHNTSLMQHGFRKDLLFTVNDYIDEDQTKLLSKSFRDHSGPHTAGGVGVLPYGINDVKEIGESNKDADYINLIREAKNRIALLYKIPLPLISPDNMTRSNYEAAQFVLYDRPVTNTFDHVFSGLAAAFNCRLPDSDKIKIVFNPHEVPALRTRQADRMETLRKSYSLSTNEIRATAGYSPLPDGDAVLGPANLLPIVSGQGDGI